MREALTDDIIASHLCGKETIGLYSSADSTTKWLCVDIDSLSESAVREPQNHARRFRIPLLTEFSGKKGYHLWVFFDKPYPNRIARALASAFAFGNEVFPKQDSIPTGKLGNLVKAPLGIHRVTRKRCLFLGNDLRPVEDQFSALAGVNAIDPVRLLKSEMPDVWSTLTSDDRKSHSARSAPNMISMPLIKDCVRNAIMTGTTEGRRNRTGHIIASELRNSGIGQSQAEALLSQVWNQRNSPPLEKEEIDTIIGSAYGSRSYTYGCREGGPLRRYLTCTGMDVCLYVTALKSMSKGG